MIRKARLFGRAVRDACSTDAEPFLTGCIFMFVTMAAVWTPMAIYTISGMHELVIYSFTTSVTLGFTAAITLPIGIGYIRYKLGKAEWEQAWNELEAEYGGA